MSIKIQPYSQNTQAVSFQKANASEIATKILEIPQKKVKLTPQLITKVKAQVALDKVKKFLGL